MSPVIGWIESRVRGLTFCDIGGIGIRSQNERVSVALKAGARQAAMIDAHSEANFEWDIFKEKMAEQKITGVEIYPGADLEGAAFAELIPRFDFVHSTGILYHMPAPVRGMENLYKVTGKYLTVNTVIVPETIQNSAGTLRFPGSQALFVPGLTEHERAVLRQYYKDKFDWSFQQFDNYAPTIESSPGSVMPWRQLSAKPGALWGKLGDLSYSPFWWLFTKSAFRALARLFDLEIVDEYSFRDHTLCLLCEKV